MILLVTLLFGDLEQISDCMFRSKVMGTYPAVELRFLLSLFIGEMQVRSTSFKKSLAKLASTRPRQPSAQARNPPIFNYV